MIERRAPRPPVGAIPERPSELTRGPAVGPDASISYVVWEITLACDLGCRHCGSRAGKARPDELSTEECLDVVRQLEELGVREVTLIGGEAYLREDWDVIAKAIVDRGMRCGITTGGRNLSAERVQRAVDAGVATISVSIDGLERTHDLQRGARGSWRAAVEAAERIAATPMRLATNTQINRLSMPELVAMADLLHELGSEAWQLQLTVPMGRAADRPELLLQPYDLLELFPLLAWIKQEKLTPRGIRAFPGNNIGYFSRYEELLRFGGDGGTHWSSCGAGTSCLGIEADGKIKACPSLPTERYTGGTSRERSVREIVEGTDELTHIGRRTREDLWGFCRGCYYADVCKAGCTWTAQVLMGRPGNNPYCIHRQLTYEAQGLHERLVRVEAAPGEPFDHGRFETVLEPIEETAEASPTILGVDLETVVRLTPDHPGLIDEREGKRRLRVVRA
jgi:radical SAM protein with 4Fe4S-binding SPASM domain